MQVGERIQASKDVWSEAHELQEETRIAGRAVLLTRGADRCVAWPLQLKGTDTAPCEAVIFKSSSPVEPLLQKASK